MLNAIATLADDGVVASPAKVGALMDPPRSGGEVMATGRSLFRAGLVTVHVPRAGLAAFKLTPEGLAAVGS